MHVALLQKLRPSIKKKDRSNKNPKYFNKIPHSTYKKYTITKVIAKF
jgi:hypothetical protein